jgi:hypothetical protein
LNAENEKPDLHGVGLLSDDTDTIEQSPRKYNGKPAPPLGAEWEDVPEGDPQRFVPTTMPPELSERDRGMLRIISEAVSACEGRPLKWQAFCVAVGQDRRSAAEIAEQFRCSKRNVEILIKAEREWLAGLRAELTVERTE